MLLGACSGQRCAPLYEAARDVCIRAAGETLFQKLKAGSRDCLETYEKAHDELRALRQTRLTRSSQAGVPRQLANLLSEQMAKRTTDGGIARLVSNLIAVESLECTLQASDSEAPGFDKWPKPVEVSGATLAGLAMAAVLMIAACVWGARPGGGLPFRNKFPERRRQEPRRHTRFRMGRVMLCDGKQDMEAPCFIVDRSPHGARIRLDLQLPIGARIFFADDAEGEIYPATVTWSRGEQAGLRLGVGAAMVRRRA